MLRKWQSACAESAINKYSSGHRHFLCLATPGAGKTVMAAEVAARLLHQDMIDAVLCFSPSVNIADGIRYTFSYRLNCSFNGGLGEVGASLTYQGLFHLNDSFWHSLSKLRLLVVFDEIHHCAGGEAPNAWGSKIIAKLQQYARYTLALTGTPWRSNASPIALAAYSKAGHIHCDFTYGMAEAIADKICRRPNIVLVDNNALTLTRSDGRTDRFGSICDFLDGSGMPYQALIGSENILRHVLKLASEKLDQIRVRTPDAAGLVVAASVQHAEAISELLWRSFKQKSVVVTYRHEKASNTINNFRHSEIPWIVSVGMVSEGTDIPRLQVCCHLSRVKTELHFRQVLGRILRMRVEDQPDAWLYTLAESNLTRFAEQLVVDVPDCHLQFERVNDFHDAQENRSGPKTLENRGVLFEEMHDDITFGNGPESPKSRYDPMTRDLFVMGTFKQRVLAHYV
ncbi:DEAD/DEAH box helicase [Enterovibrio sp. 27052020O]|uniref:DEAD/DEAH box helicase n=1 Tax=Enterovibrio sp. 27052020O TaxID=3241166 RepID=UPI00388D71B8